MSQPPKVLIVATHLKRRFAQKQHKKWAELMEMEVYDGSPIQQAPMV